MEEFNDLLVSVSNPYYDLYDKLPFDMQEIIYKMIKADVTKVLTKFYNHRLKISLKNTIRPMFVADYGGTMGGAWEHLYVKKNEWVNSFQNPRVDAFDVSLSLSALQFCRNELFFD